MLAVVAVGLTSIAVGVARRRAPRLLTGNKPVREFVVTVTK